MRLPILTVPILLLAAAPAAPAAIQCGDRDALADALMADYAEAPAFRGLAPDGRVTMELFLSLDGATWTVLRPLPDGRACLVAAGDGWELPDAPAGGDPL